MNKFYVYALIDPRNNLPFYIGKGNGNRSISHLKEKNNGANYLKINKINKIKSLGLKVIIKHLEENIFEQYAFELETKLIKHYGRLNNKTGILCNLTDGGEGTSGRVISEATRKKLSDAGTGKKLSEESKQYLSKLFKGRIDSPETKLKKKLHKREKNIQ